MHVGVLVLPMLKSANIFVRILKSSCNFAGLPASLYYTRIKHVLIIQCVLVIFLCRVQIFSTLLKFPDATNSTRKQRMKSNCSSESFQFPMKHYLGNYSARTSLHSY